MQPDYLIHDQKYKEARAKGWPGWGGPERIAGAHIWLDRLFAYDGTPKSGAVLELGCGEGNYARLLAQRGYSVTGVDVSETAIEWAKEKLADSKLDIEYHALDLTQPNILAGREFDVIVDGNCLHCIIGEDRQQFLGNVHRLLSDDGLFFISSLLSLNESDHVKELDGRPYRQAPSESNLRAELTSTGFTIQTFTIHPPRPGTTNVGTQHVTVHLSK